MQERSELIKAISDVQEILDQVGTYQQFATNGCKECARKLMIAKIKLNNIIEKV